MHVDASGLALHGQAGRQLRHSSLGASVHGRERVRDEASAGAGVHDAAFQALAQHLAVEMVSQKNVRRQVAVEIGQLLLSGVLLEEAGEDETSVVEDDLHTDVLGGLLHVSHPCPAAVGEVSLHLPNLLLRKQLLELLHCLIENRLPARHDHHVQPLRQQLPGQLFANAGRAACHQGPSRAVFLLEVLHAEYARYHAVQQQIHAGRKK
mmetsp:Transcript_22616/g.58981  ORF Transcript_22616/g.58981 Transcript_22616/m.58981 type:complete len:208 (+) Transcript_22616:662-1285(+)